MTAFLPPELLELFEPREPIPYMPPVEKLSHEKKRHPYTGVGTFDGFEDPKDTPPPTLIESRLERLERKRQEKAAKAANKLEQDIASFDPHNIPEGTTDPLKTLFVAKISSDTTESKLRREFETYGDIKKIVLVPDKKSGKPRGYAFIEYEDERDMKAAYKKSEGLKIDGNRVIVDVERSRTVKGWLPKRLGGGISEKGSSEGNGRHSGRDGASRRDSRERDRSRSRSREKERRRSDSSRPKDRRRDKELRDDKKEVQRQIRDRERRRSRSRDRKRPRRSKSRSRDRERERRRHGDGDRDRKPRVYDGVVIKTEPTSDNDSRENDGNSN